MERKLLNGVIEGFSRVKDASVATCQVGGQKIYLHRDLADEVRNGDDAYIYVVAVKDGFRALALKNITRDKVSQIDCTNNILLFGTGFVLAFIFGIIGLQGAQGPTISTIQEIIGVLGVALAVYALRATIQIMKATSVVRYSGLAGT